MMMTPKERMRVALQRGKPDRVPVAVLGDPGYLAQAAGMDRREFLYGGNSVRTEILRRAFYRHKENDFIYVTRGFSCDWMCTHKLIKEGDQYFLLHTDAGQRKELPKLWRWTNNESSHGAATPVMCIEDIRRKFGELPAPNAIVQQGYFDPLRTLVSEMGDEVFTAFPVSNIFPRAVHHLGGFEKAMIALKESPDLVGALLEEITGRAKLWIRAGARFRPDACWIDAYLEGTDIISPQTWRSLVKPRHAQLVKEAKEHGLFVLFWFLGDCMPLLNDIVEIGVDGLVVEQSRCGYSSDPGEIRRIVGKKICVYGWSGELEMIHADYPAIRRRIEEQIKAAGFDGAFIMGSTLLTSEVKCETVDYFCQQVVEASQRFCGS